MAGEKSTLKAGLLAAFNQQINSTEDQPGPITQLSESQASAIVDAIISAINSTTVTHVLTAPNGPVTGSITLQSTAS
jgi:hypothetical protein